jgi:hypothetical protein
MPFKDDLDREVAIHLAMTGQVLGHEAAQLAGVSRQGLYLHLPEGVDLVKRRKAYLRKLWRQTEHELERS